MELELLRAREAIFKLIAQYHLISKSEDGELYIHTYCESALESAFDVLGIASDYISLYDFCNMWERNNRLIWSLSVPNEPYGGVMADVYYDVLKESETKEN